MALKSNAKRWNDWGQFTKGTIFWRSDWREWPLWCRLSAGLRRPTTIPPKRSRCKEASRTSSLRSGALRQTSILRLRRKPKRLTSDRGRLGYLNKNIAGSPKGDQISVTGATLGTAAKDRLVVIAGKMKVGDTVLV